MVTFVLLLLLLFLMMTKMTMTMMMMMNALSFHPQKSIERKYTSLA